MNGWPLAATIMGMGLPFVILLVKFLWEMIPKKQVSTELRKDDKIIDELKSDFDTFKTVITDNLSKSFESVNKRIDKVYELIAEGNIHGK